MVERRTVILGVLLIFIIIGSAFVADPRAFVSSKAPSAVTSTSTFSTVTDTITEKASTVTVLTPGPTTTSVSLATATATTTTTSLICCETKTAAATTTTVTTTVTSTITSSSSASSSTQGPLTITVAAGTNPAPDGSSDTVSVTLFNNLQIPQSITASTEVIATPSGDTAAITFPSQTSISVNIQPGASFPWGFNVGIASDAPTGEYQIQIAGTSSYGTTTAILSLNVGSTTNSSVSVLQQVANAPDCNPASGTATVVASFTGSIPAGSVIVALAEGDGHGISLAFTDSLGNTFTTAGSVTGYANAEVAAGYSKVTNSGSSGDTITATITGTGTVQACAINIYLVSGLPSGYSVQPSTSYCSTSCSTSVATSSSTSLNTPYFAASMCQGLGAACMISTPTAGFTKLGSANGGEYSTSGATSPTTWAITVGAGLSGWQYIGVAFG